MQDAKSLEGIRVLVMEDEYLIADDLARALKAAGAVPVGPAPTVERAEELLTGTRVDAAILDLNLHGNMASGFVERLVATGLPCLIVSGYSEDAMPAAVEGVPRLEKPINPGAVVKALEEQLARTA